MRRESVRLTLPGLFPGGVAAVLVVVRLLRSMLVGVSPNDPLSADQSARCGLIQSSRLDASQSALIATWRGERIL